MEEERKQPMSKSTRSKEMGGMMVVVVLGNEPIGPWDRTVVDRCNGRMDGMECRSSCPSTPRHDGFETTAHEIRVPRKTSR